MSPSAVDKSGDRVRRMFAAIASKYDAMNHLLSLNIDRSWRRRTVRMLPPHGEAPILDLCTGTGDLALEYWKVTAGRTSIVGVDFCPEMLAVAERKKERSGGGDELRFLEADAQALPFPADHFQIVTVAFGLRNVEDTRQGLREIHRVCRPGGRVGILEFSRPTVWPLSALYRLYFQHVLPKLGQRFARNPESAYAYLPQSVMEFPDGARLARLIEETGFRAVTFHSFTGGIATLYLGTK